MIEEKNYRIRLDTFNLLKGILIIYMVLLHKVDFYGDNVVVKFFASTAGRVLYIGAMPAFFMISGMNIRPAPLRKNLAKNFRELIIPYLYVMVACAVFFPLVHYVTFKWWPGALHESTRYILAFLLGVAKPGKSFLGYDLYWCSPVWFLLALFISLNALNLILKVKKEKLQPILVVLSTVCGYILGKFNFDYFCISQGLIAVGYCYIGFLIKKQKLYTNKYFSWAWILFLIPAIYQTKNGNFNLAYSEYIRGYLECILAVFAGMLLVFLGIACGRKEWKILDPIKNVGVYTYWILCIHSVETCCIPWYRWSEYMGDKQLLAFCVDLGLTTLLMVAGCIILKKISKWNYKHSSEGGGLRYVLSIVVRYLVQDEKRYKIRLDTFNVLKGLLIVYVVLMHKEGFYNDGTLNKIFTSDMAKVISAGAMPAFFIITGMSFRATSTKKCLAKTFNELVKPYLCVMLIFAACFPVIHYIAFDWWEAALRESTRYFLAFLLGVPKSGKTLLGYDLYWCSVTWFLLAMFIALNLLNLILQVKNVKIQYCLVLIASVCGYVLAKYDFDYYCIPQGLIALGYCYTGMLLKKTKFHEKKYLPIICLFLLIPAMIQTKKGEFSMAYSIFKLGYLECYLGACSGLLLVFLGIIFGRIEWKVLDPLKSIGIHTYWILCIHAVETCCLPWYKWSECMGSNQMVAFLIDLASTSLLMIISCAILKKISRWNYKRRMTSNGKELLFEKRS